MTVASRWSALHSGSARWGQSLRPRCVAVVFGLQWTCSCAQARVRIPYERVVSRSLDGLQSATRCNGLT
ncbi:hypothetical protein PF005_g15101 [Phytophthora fragariae]|uniref:Uncharacterized protein n=2 Tax=Phytophthora TaxID=4783 RepID=A0A6A3EP12_9STRA|nr:hypothetical protein PF009_g16400 [Phytophthora fragariae]KAE9333337.1 hypothetical protein PR003_g14073 [Phytophthora rubi]KAE9099759.1 hypothetical protein PF007_g15755 [Phytophthora fragariae]KAE9136125.1 hypothetical protein PF006_g14457 [Phytophthora fragariae]KAE9201057.1 hypothetical protein PF005_g15101 [Phytophthora fragariae]